ncbi:MAG: sialidase family protein [Candidatus Pacearchaeota archaeon]
MINYKKSIIILVIIFFLILFLFLKNSVNYHIQCDVLTEKICADVHEPVNLNEIFNKKENNSHSPQIAIDSKGNPYVVYYQGFAYYDGKKWIEKNITDLWVPDIAIASDDSIHVVYNLWGRITNYINSFDKGESWGNHVVLHPNYGYWANIFIDKNDTIHVVWGRDSLDNNLDTVFYSRSSDFGKTWFNSSILMGSNEPKVAVDNLGYIHVVVGNQVCADQGINGDFWCGVSYSRSTDGGLTWSTPWNFDSDALPGNKSGHPHVAADSKGNVYIVWSQNNNLFYRISKDNGKTWSKEKKIPFKGYAFFTEIVVDENDNLHAVWADGGGVDANEFNGRGIFYSIYDGNKWTNPIVISNPNVSAYRPGIAINKNKIGIVWAGGGGHPINDENVFFNSIDILQIK